MGGNPSVDWSYSGSPNTSTLDAVRFLVGDTIEADPLVRNSEILYAIAQKGNEFMAAALVAEAIAAKLGREADLKVDAVDVKKSQRAAAYRKLAQDLRTQGLDCATPTFGGVFKADKERWANDESLVQPFFSRNMHDHPRAPHQFSLLGDEDTD